MAPLIPLDDRLSRVPLYRQIYGGLRTAIVERLLRPGQRLPSTRALAAELEVSRIPVLEAFEQLLAEGYCESRVGTGYLRGAGSPQPTLLGRSRRASPGAAGPWSPAVRRGAERALGTRGAGAFRMNHPPTSSVFPCTSGRGWSPNTRAIHPRMSFITARRSGLPALREAVGRVPAYVPRRALRSRPVS